MAIAIEVRADYLWINDAPALVRQQRPRRALCLAFVDGNFEYRRSDLAGQVEKAPKLHIFLPIGLAVVDHGVIARPVHDRGEDLPVRCCWVPLRQHDRLPCRTPAMPGVRDSGGQMFSEAEMHIVGGEELAEVRLPTRQLDLGEDGVRVDVGQPPHLPVVLRTLEHAGDVNQEIGGADHVRTLRLSQAEPL